MFTAELRGTVQDPAEAAISGARVTITNEATQIAEERVAVEAGRYLFNDLRPARYTVRVEAAGFNGAHNLTASGEQRTLLNAN